MTEETGTAEGAAPEGVKTIANVVHIDEERIKGHLDRIVRGSVEETLNQLLDVEAQRLCGAEGTVRANAPLDRRQGRGLGGRCPALASLPVRSAISSLHPR